MIIDGKKIAQEILQDLRSDVRQLPFRPIFCDVLVGDNEVSLSYVNIKKQAAEAIGVKFLLEQLPATASQEVIIKKIELLNRLPLLCGLIVQLPLPGQINQNEVLDSIKPELDVDCLGAYTMAQFYENRSPLLPPTAAAILMVLAATEQSLVGKNIVVVGQGQLVGRPVAHLLRQRGLTVQVATVETKDLSELTLQADVIIMGTGQPRLLTGDMVREGCIVIDAGTAERDGGIVGDIDFASVAPKTSAVTPVPGGVGPLTVSMVLYNVVRTAQKIIG